MNQRSAQYGDKTYKNCIIIPFIGKDSHRFAKRISALISNRFNLKVLPIFKTFKVKNYFLLKSRTPKALCSNVIYKFTGSCDTNMTYIGTILRHLITRDREHLNFKSIQEGAVKNHSLSCDSCSSVKFD